MPGRAPQEHRPDHRDVQEQFGQLGRGDVAIAECTAEMIRPGVHSGNAI